MRGFRGFRGLRRFRYLAPGGRYNYSDGARKPLEKCKPQAFSFFFLFIFPSTVPLCGDTVMGACVSPRKIHDVNSGGLTLQFSQMPSM